MRLSRNSQNLSQFKEYQALVGSFLYLQVHSFPDIQAVSVLSKYMIRPGPTHLVITSALPERSQERHSTTVRSRLHRRTPARHKSMDMPTHPLPTQSLFDTRQSDTSSCSTELQSVGARVELLGSFSTQQKPSCTVYLAPLKKPSIFVRCASS